MYQPMVRNGPGSESHDYRTSSAFQEVEGLLKQDLLSLEAQEQLIEAMSPSAQRHIVMKISTLDTSILMTFKKQIQMVDAVLRRIVSPDGTVIGDPEEMGMSPKDALNMSLRLTQVMTRELPKLYTIDRIQKQEEALRTVMQRHLTREQQDELLQELESLESSNMGQ